jgi:hypothetical protein
MFNGKSVSSAECLSREQSESVTRITMDWSERASLFLRLRRFVRVRREICGLPDTGYKRIKMQPLGHALSKIGVLCRSDQIG